MRKILRFLIGNDPSTCHLAYDDAAMTGSVIELTIAKDGSLFLQLIEWPEQGMPEMRILDTSGERPLSSKPETVDIQSQLRIGRMERRIGQLIAELLTLGSRSTANTALKILPAVRPFRRSLDLETQLVTDAAMPGMRAIANTSGDILSRGNPGLPTTVDPPQKVQAPRPAKASEESSSEQKTGRVRIINDEGKPEWI